MAVITKIGDRLVNADWEQTSIQDVFTSVGDFCDISLVYDGPNAEYGKNFLPLTGELLTVEYWDGIHGTEVAPEVLFRGPITERELSYAPGGSTVSAQAEDLTFRLNSKMVAGVFTQRTVEEMVAELVNQHGPRDEDGNLTIKLRFSGGVETRDGETPAETAERVPAVQRTSILPRVVQWKEFGEVLQEIAEQRRYNWWVDFEGFLNFIPRTDPRNRAPIAEVRPVTDIRIRGFKYTVSIAELKNAIYIKEFWFESPNNIHGPGPEDATGADEENFTEPIGGRANPGLNVGNNNVIADLLNFSVYVREGGESQFRLYPAVYDPGPGSPRAPGYVYVIGGSGNFTIVRNDADNPTFPAGTVAYWNYRALQRHTIPELVIDTESIEEFRRRETGELAGNGEYQFMLSFGALEFGGDNPFTVLHNYVTTYLNQYAWPVVEGSFEVVYSLGDNLGAGNDGFGWRAGQAFDVFNEDLGLFSQPVFYRTGNKVPAQVLVSSVTSTFYNPTTINYKIDFTSQFSNV